MIRHKSCKLTGPALAEFICKTLKEVENHPNHHRLISSTKLPHNIHSNAISSSSSSSIDNRQDRDDSVTECELLPQDVDTFIHLSVVLVSPLNCDISHNFTYLSLHGPAMTALMKWFPRHGINTVMGMKSLQKLCITGFQRNLSKLPCSLGELIYLRHLNVSHNGLSCLPMELGKLHLLRILNVSNNQLSILPWTMKFCQDLQSINLSHNAFRKLPPFLETLPHLQTLQRLYNLFQHEYRTILVEHSINFVREDVYITEVSAPRKCPTLKHFAMSRLLSMGIPLTSPNLLPPTLLKEAFIVSRKTLFCDVCHAPLRFHISDCSSCDLVAIFPKFLKNKFLPVYFQFCSQRCKETQKALLLTRKFSECDEELDIEREEIQNRISTTMERRGKLSRKSLFSCLRGSDFRNT